LQNLPTYHCNFFITEEGASQGAQEETPRPINFEIPGTSSHKVSAPVATIIDFAV